MNDIEKAIQRIKNLKQISVKNNNRDYDLAISALEKQIPKKIDYSELNYSNLPVAKCPKCNSTIINSDRLLSSANYCPECGQKLDWEVETDE